RHHAGDLRYGASGLRLDHGAGETTATDDDAAARRHPRPDRQRHRDRGAETAVSTRIETTLRATVPIWARAALALLALGGVAGLASIRPSLPALPWQPIQPTRDELIRQTIV